MPTKEDRQRIEAQAQAIAKLRGAVFEYLVADDTPQDAAYHLATDSGDGDADLVDELLDLIAAARTNYLRDALEGDGGAAS